MREHLQRECMMRSFLTNIRLVAGFVAFIAALLAGMSLVTVSNAAVVPGSPVIGNPAAVQAVVPPMGVKAVDSRAFNRPNFNKPNFNFNRPNFNKPNFNFNKPNFFRPNFLRPAFNPFFGADLDLDFD